jgi:uncharacterized membrane protein YkvA (DUF1232 family)
LKKPIQTVNRTQERLLKAIDSLKATAAALKREVYALYLAARDPRTPWYGRVFAGFVIAYALSPIDLIPDPIPIFGYLDDLLLLPLGIYFAIQMIPEQVLTECRQKAALPREPLRKNWLAGAVVIAVWIAAAAVLMIYFWRAAGGSGALGETTAR